MAHQKSADPNVFILPDLGEGVHEGELIKWRVSVGQAVKDGDTLAEFETDKALCEVYSPRDGVIATLHGKEGEILYVGNPLVTFEGAAPVESRSTTPPTTASTAAGKHNGSHAHGKAADAPEPKAEREDAGTVVGNMSGGLAGIAGEPGKALATPAVRRLARDLGVDIDRVSGTGIGGRVLEKDVRAAAAGVKGAVAPSHAPSGRSTSSPIHSPTQPPAPPAAPSHAAPRAAEPDLSRAMASGSAAPDETTRVPIRGVRRTIASRLRESMNQAVHFTVMDEADVSALDALRRKLGSASGEKVSFLPFVASAVCRVLGRAEFRSMNATVEEKAGEADWSVVQHRGVHLGIATDTDSGLMVPVIRDCDRLGVLQISRSIAAIAEQARARTIARESLMGGTFTISNVGSHAGRFATPVINYPEVAILAVGRARPAPVVRGGGLFVGNLLPLSLACDHRVVDGATAALALAEIVRLLQDDAESLLGPARG